MSRKLDGGDAARLDRLRAAALCQWFARSARDLPWRRERARHGAWGALVVETLLQQTQAARVAERFDAFVARFPTAAAMADAEVHDVLALWQGLGYYRRARNLHAAAVMIRDRFGGEVPARHDELLSLPGVGRYTAGAIASILFGQPRPIVDGNVQRVLARWDALGRRPQDRLAIRWTWRRAAQLVVAAGPGMAGAFNEGVMELGATLCTPRSPRCDQCPVARWCVALQLDRVAMIPPPKPAPPTLRVHHHALVIERGGKLLLERRPADGMWANLWQPPTIESDRRLSQRQTTARLKRTRKLTVSALARPRTFTYGTTHRTVIFHVTRATLSDDSQGLAAVDAPMANTGMHWLRRDELATVPLSSAHRRVLADA
jgi:A/G-specific adenine glycosylase